MINSIMIWHRFKNIHVPNIINCKLLAFWNPVWKPRNTAFQNAAGSRNNALLYRFKLKSLLNIIINIIFCKVPGFSVKRQRISFLSLKFDWIFSMSWLQTSRNCFLGQLWRASFDARSILFWKTNYFLGNLGSFQKKPSKCV